MKLCLLCLFLANSLSVRLSASSPQAVFSGLGDLVGGDVSSSASGVSGDGSTVVGQSSSANGPEGYYWKSGAGMIGTGDLSSDGVSDQFSSNLLGTNQAGTYLCGSGTTGAQSSPSVYATRWNASTGLIQLPDLSSSGINFSFAVDSSSNGQMIIGRSLTTNGFRAFLWTETGAPNGTTSDLGFLLPTPILTGDEVGVTSSASAITPSGSHVVGKSGYSVVTVETVQPPPIITYEYIDNGDGTYTLVPKLTPVDPYDVRTVIEQGNEAFIWTSGGGMVGLGDLPGGGAKSSDALAVSSDGSVVVGSGNSGQGPEAVIWRNGVIEALGDLDGGETNARLLDINSSGSIAVGQGTTASGAVAMVWNDALGLGNLKSLLVGQGVDMSGWTLTEATGISEDGQVIVGNGINPDGNPEAWRITDALVLLNILIPPPEGLQESMRVVRGKAAQFTAEPGRDYQLLGSTDLVNWSVQGDPLVTDNSVSPYEHALPISGNHPTVFFLLGPSANPNEADTPITLIEGTLVQYTSTRGYTYRPEYSDDLLTWTPFGETVDTSSDQGPVDRVFIDTTAAINHPQRFYRIQTAPTEFLTTPFDLVVGDFIVATAEPGQDYQIRRSTELDSGSGQWINFSDYGPLLTAGGSTTPITWYVFIPPRTNPASDSYLGVSIPQEEIQSSGFFSGGEGAVVRFTSQPGFIYQVQASADGSLFTNLGSPINTATNTGPAEQMVIDSYDTAGPAPHLAYRVIETPVE
ncbi:MAG: hypothetical protein ACPG4K_06860 [Haloferula sp.]